MKDFYWQKRPSFNSNSNLKCTLAVFETFKKIYVTFSLAGQEITPPFFGSRVYID
jgi:hypothetical protein